jgi:hypothetical protein
VFESVSGCGTCIESFINTKRYYPRIYVTVAQLVERVIIKCEVGRSRQSNPIFYTSFMYALIFLKTKDR